MGGSKIRFCVIQYVNDPIGAKGDFGNFLSSQLHLFDWQTTGLRLTGNACLPISVTVNLDLRGGRAIELYAVKLADCVPKDTKNNNRNFARSVCAHPLLQRATVLSAQLIH